MDTLKINTVTEAVGTLRKTPGLGNARLLNEPLKKLILELEDKNNIGVRECLSKPNCIFITHNSGFRQPEHSMVAERKGKIIFPAIPFKELEQFNAISSSPTAKLHKFLENILRLELKDNEASLIIGLD